MKLPLSRLNDGLDDDVLIDEQGYPIDMAADERNAIEEMEYDSCLAQAVEENLQALAFEKSVGF